MMIDKPIPGWLTRGLGMVRLLQTLETYNGFLTGGSLVRAYLDLPAGKDLDILIPATHVRAVRTGLESCGYAVTEESSGREGDPNIAWRGVLDPPSITADKLDWLPVDLLGVNDTAKLGENPQQSYKKHLFAFLQSYDGAAFRQVWSPTHGWWATDMKVIDSMELGEIGWEDTSHTSPSRIVRWTALLAGKKETALVNLINPGQEPKGFLTCIPVIPSSQQGDEL